MPESAESAENLLNFVNTASSNVKTVLSKPGCFKRNTNHRRFLQKQLKLTSPKISDKGNENGKKTFAISKIRKRRSPPVARISFFKNVNLPRENRLKTNSFFQRQARPSENFTVGFTNETARQFQQRHSSSHNYPSLEFPYFYQEQTTEEPFNNFDSDFSTYIEDNEQSQRFCEIVDGIVHNLLESSDFDRWSSDEDLSDSSVVNSPPALPSTSSAKDMDLNKSYSEFLSGEELVESLDVSDLFIPHGYQDCINTDVPVLTSASQAIFSPTFDNGFRFFPTLQ